MIEIKCDNCQTNFSHQNYHFCKSCYDKNIIIITQLKTVTAQRDIAVGLLDTALSCIDSSIHYTTYDLIEKYIYKIKDEGAVDEIS